MNTDNLGLDLFSHKVQYDLAAGWQFWRASPNSPWTVLPGEGHPYPLPAGIKPLITETFVHERLTALINKKLIHITGTRAQHIVLT